MTGLVRTGSLFRNGHTLSDASWSSRHHAVKALLGVMIVATVPFGLWMGASPTWASLLLAIPVAAIVMDRYTATRWVRACLLTFGLFTSAASYVALSSGAPEAHFLFFVLVGVIALYQDWRPFLSGIAFVLVHHTILNVMLPGAVFRYSGATTAPYHLPLIHSALLLASSVASIVAWKANEAEALSDALTGLPNRRMLQSELDRQLGDSRSPGVGLVLLDLCGFTKVNDAYGHLAGDRVLIEVGQRLGEIAAESTGFLARSGGDEFAIVVPRATIGEVLAIAERIVRSLDGSVMIGGRSAHLTVSMGVLVAQPGMSTTAEMLRDVAVAKDSAKRQHGELGGMCVFYPALREQARQAFELELDLAECVERNELVVLYQPIVDLVTGRMVGAEALVRWEHPMLGPLGPQAFIPTAERTGDIVKIGRWVLGEATRQLAAWNATLPHREALSIHVNVSTHQLSDPAIVGDVRRCIDNTGIVAGRLVIEITESAALAGQRELLVLRRLKRLGVRIALDDFGTGYSSLSHLAQLPIDEIKIDKSFTDDIPTGPNGRLLAGVLALAAQIGMATVIEGVEHAEQVDGLIEMGARLAQGFLFGRPLRAGDFSRQLALQQGAADPFDEPRRMQTVLIVDDDELMSAMLARHLHQLGYSTVQASCADHALTLARALPPAFAVVDAEMPGTDGWTLIDQMQADEIVEELQVVIVSGSATTGHADRAAREGLLFVDKSDRRLRSRLKESIEALDHTRQDQLR